MFLKRQKTPSSAPIREGTDGQRARHAIKGNRVNVGDPGSSKEVSGNEHKSEKPEMTVRESEGSSAGEASNDGGEKDPSATNKKSFCLGAPILYNS